MYTSLRVKEVLNSDEELLAFPIEGTVKIALDNKPDSFLLNKYVYIIRHDGSLDTSMPNIGDRFIRAVGDVSVDKYDVVPTSTVVTELDGSWILSSTPDEVLIPNAEYYLVISKNLPPQHYTNEKVESLGSSSVEVETEVSGDGEDATYIIDINTQSALSTGSHLIEFSVLKNGLSHEASVTLDIRKDRYELSPGVWVKFDPNVPFLVGERFRIICTAFTRIGETLLQPLATNISSNIVQPSAEIQSKRAGEADILKFYEDNGWASRVPEEAPGSSIETLPLSYEFIYPNTIIVDAGVAIDMTTLTPDKFNISIGYAFGNYMLTNMGLFDEEAQHTVTYYILNNTKIKIVIEKSDSVPEGEKFLVVNGGTL